MRALPTLLTAGGILALIAGLADPVHAQRCTIQPRLNHSAPHLGHELSVEVVHAPPGARLALFAAPAADEVPTGCGLLELARGRLRTLAAGAADASGAWATRMRLPADVVFAESELHLQALIVDATMPSGLVLSEAAHLRVVGPRVYAGWRGHGVGREAREHGGLAIVSAARGEEIARLDYGAAWTDGDAVGDGRPDFDPASLLGAVMASPRQLVVFEPFFGREIGRVGFENASRTLFVQPGRDRVLVLETGAGRVPARLVAVELSGARVVEQLALPHAATGLWTVDDERSAAFVAYTDDAGRTCVRVVDLGRLNNRGALAVGRSESDSFTDMLWAYDRLYVATRCPDDAGAARGELTLVELPRPIDVWGGGGARARVFPCPAWISQLTALPAAGTIAAFELQPDVPSGRLVLMPRGNPAAEYSPGLPWVYLHVDGLVPDGEDLWVLDASENEPPTATDPGRLYHLSTGRIRWTQYPTTWPSGGPVAITSVRVGRNDVLALAVAGRLPPLGPMPELWLVDPDAGRPSELRLPLGWNPDALRATGVPPVP